MAEEKPMDKEAYKEGLENKIEDKKWAQKFLKTNDWKKLAGFIAGAYPSISPYSLTKMEDIKAQGGYIKGLTFPETLLLTLIKEGDEAMIEIQTNPDAK